MSRALLAALTVLALPASAVALPLSFTSNPKATGDDPRAVAIADFDEDGKLDLAVVNESVDDDPSQPPAQGPGTVSILLGNGDGSFATGTPVTVGERPRAILAGMFNTGADPDLAVANFADDTISILAGAAGATFGSPVAYAVGNGPRALAAGLLGGGTDPDLAVANEHDDNVSVLAGGTGTTFGAATNHATGGSPSGVGVGDFDGDLDPDLAVANLADDDVSVLRGGVGSTFAAKTDHPAGDGPRGVGVADFNGDGDLDLAIPVENEDAVAILLGGAGASFGTPTKVPAGDAPRGIAVADFTRDGDPDLVTANDQGNGITIMVGGPGASFAPPVALPSGIAPFGVSAADFDGDGEQDIVVANTGDDSVTVLLNRTPPDTTITGGPEGLTNDTTPGFTFAADEPGATFQCRYDAAPFAACVEPVFGDGAHSVEVRAVDPAGNVDPTPVTRFFTVDATPPTASVDSGPPALTSDTTPTFTFSSSEAGSALACRVDGGELAPCASPLTLAAVGDGAHTLEVRATDPAGNVGPVSAPRGFTVDATAPETAISAGPSGLAIGLTPTFRFAASQAGATFECRLDARPFARCSSPFTARLAKGRHSFAVRAIDPAGNVDASPATRAFTALALLTPPVSDSWQSGGTTRVVRLVARGVPRGARVELRCSSRRRGCRFTRKTVKPTRRGTASMTRILRSSRLRPRAVVEIRITAAHSVGRVVRFTVRRGDVPRRRVLCLQPGASRPRSCPR